MSRLSPLDWHDGYSTQHELSIRTEYTRFACMFYFFTFLAFFITLILFLLAHQSYYDESETIQRRFLPFAVLTTISLLLCFVFTFGSFVYTRKFLRTRKCSTSSRFDQSSIGERVKEEMIQPFTLNTDESYYANTKPRTDLQMKTSPTIKHYQTDV